MLPPVVWVTTEIAQAAPRSGGQLRTQRLLAHLADRTPVDVVAVQDATDAEVVQRLTGARRVLAVRRAGPLATRSLALRHRWPIAVAEAGGIAARAAVATLAGRPSLLVLDHESSLAHVPRRGPYLVNVHNVESHRLGDLPSAASRRRQVEVGADARAYRRLEGRLVRDPRATPVAVSDVEAERLGGDRTAVVPNGADLPDDPPPPPADGDLLFVGALDYAPNVAAVRWWADEVWHHLPPGTPPLTVVGRNPQLLPAALAAHPGVRLAGSVDDLAPVLAAAAAVVIPLQHGGGTRLKVLEALAWGRPLVTTRKGSEGIELRDGEEALLADRPDELATAVVRVRSDSAVAGRLSVNGRAVAARYAWPLLGERFAELAAAAWGRRAP